MLDYVKWLWINKKSTEDYKTKFDKLLKNIWRRTEKEPIGKEEIDKIVEEVRSKRYAKSGH